jgi:hypothetical protein
MSSPVTPAIVLGGISYANNLYNEKFSVSGFTDVRPLLFAGIAGLLLAAFGAIPGTEPVAVRVGWIAVVGSLIAPIQNPSPVQNLLALTKSATAKK